MTFYERMDALATRQITAKGSEITIQSSPTAGDPVTGLGASDGATRTVTAVVTGIDYKTFPETLVQVGDKMLLIDEVVQVGERWVDGGAEYSVVATKEIKPDNSTFLVCRRLSVADNFGAQLTAWAEKTGQSLREVDVGFKLALFDRAVRRTRVDTGRMKGNWQITNGSPAAGETGAFKTNSSANKFQPEIGLTESDEALIAPFSVTYLTNNVPYAVVWEEVDAMAGGAISEARQLLAAELAKDD